ncbi:MAG: carbohydrate ABC transporter permease [bacterium]
MKLQNMSGGRISRIAMRSLLYIILSAGAVAVAWPIVWMFLSVFKTTEEILRVPPTLLPRNPTVSHFRDLFSLYPFFRSYINSLIVTASGTFLVLLTSSLAGYIFAKFKFPGNNIFFVATLATIMIPAQMKIIPLYLIVKGLGWLNTYQGIIAPGIVEAFGIFLMRQFMQSLPDDYLDAARVDGLSEFGIYARIALPLMKPGISVLAIIVVLGSWEALLWPLIVINSTEMRTLPLLLNAISGKGARYDLTMAGAALTSLPPLIVFFLFQRQFIKVAALSGLK